MTDPLGVLHNYLFQAVWVGWAAYWAFSSASASKPKRVQSPYARLLHRMELLFAFALLAIPELRAGWLGRRIIPWSESLFVAGAVMLVLGIGFAIWARVHLGQNWSGHVTLKAGHRLIRSGPYAIVRHPIYTGILMAIIGTAVALDDYAGVIAILIVTETFVRKLRIEERWLTEEFGDEHRAYRWEVKALIPGVA
jgi:protein-S-isoprenylcysteine O-methyltransferase Ste14